MFFVAAAVAVISLSSCKKDYTCSCTANNDMNDISYTEEMKKKDAEEWCDSWDTSGQGIEGWKCELK